MNLFHLFSISVLALGISAHTAPEDSQIAVPVNTTKVVSPSDDGDRDAIPWKPSQRLTWDDFLCEPRRGTDAVASTSTSLGIAYQMDNGALSYHITCSFSKSKSWGLIKNEYILAHEQGHFDITEIFARKLNEALQNYQFNRKTFKRDVSQIYQSIVDEKERYQKMYDEETDHSRNKKIQMEWLDKIQSMLDETEPYEQYP